MFASLFLLQIFLFCNSISPPQPQVIQFLPGYEKGQQPLPFRLYGDYIEVSKGRHYYYTFVESLGRPDSDPVVLFLNGGPGCSSLQGFTIEVGPLGLQPDGKTLLLNEFSWTKSSSMIFLEAPCGVGFSYFDDPKEVVTWNDDLVAEDIVSFLVEFFSIFPQFSKNEFFIAGESYAGYYVPVLVKHLHEQQDVAVNLKGWAVGNGLFDDENDYNSIPEFLWQHSLVTRKDYESVLQICHGDPYSHKNDSECLKSFQTLSNSVMFAGINPYFLYDECLPSPMPTTQSFFAQASTWGVGHECADIFKVEAYLNRTDVKKSLHAKIDINWQIYLKYQRIYHSMVPFYQNLLPFYRALFYSGDCDSIVNSVGSSEGISKVGLPISVPWKVWKIGKLPGGFYQVFDGGKLTFASVRGAGHMCPIQQPEASLQLFQKFLNGTCC